MAVRALLGLTFITFASAWLGCGGDDDHPSTATRNDAGTQLDSGTQTKIDAGKDAGHPADAATSDAATEDAASDAGSDSGLPGDDAALPDSGPAPEVVPADWSCFAALYHDGHCDCGCTVHDPDCYVSSCNEPGPCTEQGCEACFNADGSYRPCAPPPSLDDFTCDHALLGDGQCDCGCGVPDPDCMVKSCTGPGCRAPGGFCDTRHGCGNGITELSEDDCSTNNPAALMNGDWVCPWDSYGSGDGCDCGCGVLDPDCAGGGCIGARCYASSCDRCNDENGRPYACTAAAGGWDDAVAITADHSYCESRHFDSQDGCDCGCGGHDPDCGTAGCDTPGCGAAGCDRCTDNAGQPTGCAPSAWLTACPAENYGTGDGCDCGCGVPDPDCGGHGSSNLSFTSTCDVCHDSAYAPSDPLHHYVACPKWTCDASKVNDTSCSCGCGAIDPYCRISSRYNCTAPGCSETAACDDCYGAGGGATSCDTGWSMAGVTCDLSYYARDGLCDCGCGAPDPDCAGKVACTAADCDAPDCDVCHGAGLLAVCDAWRCDVSAFASGGQHACDCGCGAPDPDCAGQGCTEPGCAAAACDVCHDALGRPVQCP